MPLRETRLMLCSFKWMPEADAWEISWWAEKAGHWVKSQNIKVDEDNVIWLLFEMDKKTINYRWVKTEIPTPEELEGKI